MENKIELVQLLASDPDFCDFDVEELEDLVEYVSTLE